MYIFPSPCKQKPAVTYSLFIQLHLVVKDEKELLTGGLTYRSPWWRKSWWDLRGIWCSGTAGTHPLQYNSLSPLHLSHFHLKLGNNNTGQIVEIKNPKQNVTLPHLHTLIYSCIQMYAFTPISGLVHTFLCIVKNIAFLTAFHPRAKRFLGH